MKKGPVETDPGRFPKPESAQLEHYKSKMTSKPKHSSNDLGQSPAKAWKGKREQFLNVRQPDREPFRLIFSS